VEPIYLCMDALAARRTFGTSGYPLDGTHGGRQIEYVKGLCPRAERALDQMVGMTIHENFTDEDILDIAAGVRKVALGLAEKRAAA
jgi:hypothetical protein